MSEPMSLAEKTELMAQILNAAAQRLNINFTEFSAMLRDFANTAEEIVKEREEGKTIQ